MQYGFTFLYIFTHLLNMFDSIVHGLKLLLPSSQDVTTSVNQTYEFELFKLYKTM